MTKKAANTLTGWLIITIIFAAMNASQIRAAAYQKCAESKTAVEPNRQYASDNDSIILPSLDGKLISLTKNNLIYLWKTDLGGKIVSDVFEKNKFVYVVSQVINTDKNLDGDEKGINEQAEKDILWMIDEETGLIAKKLLLEKSESYYFLDYGVEVVLITSAGKILTYQNNLVLVNETDTKMPVTVQPIQLDNALYLADKNRIYSFDLEKHSLNAAVERLTAVSKFGVFGKTVFLFGDLLGNLSFYDKNREKVAWKFRTGGQITNLTVFNNTILAASVDGFIYSLNSKGGLRWKHRLRERINGAFFSTGNSLMFGLAGEENLTVIDLKDGSEKDSLGIVGNPYFAGSTEFDSGQFIVLSDNKVSVYSTLNCPRVN